MFSAVSTFKAFEQVEIGENAVLRQLTGRVGTSTMQADLDAFHSIENERLSKVLWRNGGEAPEALWLIFERRTLLIQANGAYDTITVAAGEAVQVGWCTDLSSSNFWRDFLGQPFGWGWVATNQQGYRDAVLLSFGGITPQVMLEVIASSMKLHRIGEPEPIDNRLP